MTEPESNLPHAGGQVPLSGSLPAEERFESSACNQEIEELLFLIKQRDDTIKADYVEAFNDICHLNDKITYASIAAAPHIAKLVEEKAKLEDEGLKLLFIIKDLRTDKGNAIEALSEEINSLEDKLAKAYEQLTEQRLLRDKDATQSKLLLDATYANSNSWMEKARGYAEEATRAKEELLNVNKQLKAAEEERDKALAEAQHLRTFILQISTIPI